MGTHLVKIRTSDRGIYVDFILSSVYKIIVFRMQTTGLLCSSIMFWLFSFTACTEDIRKIYCDHANLEILSQKEEQPIWRNTKELAKF